MSAAWRSWSTSSASTRYVRWTVKHWCHMVSDTSFDELHAFAAALGIPRERFQRDHYDLPPILRARAVAQGADRSRSPTCPGAWPGRAASATARGAPRRADAAGA